MPIEIRELVIKAQIREGSRESSPRPGRNAAIDKAEIVKAAVEEVLQILKDQQSR